MRKILAIILSIAMVVSFIPTTAFAAGEGNVTFTKVTSVEAGSEYLIVAKSGSNYYALKNDSNNKQEVNPSTDGNTITLTEADAGKVTWSVAAAQGQALEKGPFTFTNSGKTLWREGNDNKVGFGTDTNDARYGMRCDGVSISNANSTGQYTFYLNYQGSTFSFNTQTKPTNITIYKKSVNGGGETPQPSTGGDKYLIISNGYALSSASTGSYTTSGGTYSGFKGVSYTAGTTTVTDAMLWDVTNNGSSYTISQNGKYLTGSYVGNSGSATGNLQLGNTSNTWNYSGNRLSMSGYYLTHSDGTSGVTGSPNVFSMRSSGNAGTITFQKYTGGTTPPVNPPTPTDGTVYVGFTSDVHGDMTNLGNWFDMLDVVLQNMCFCGDYGNSSTSGNTYLQSFKDTVSKTNAKWGNDKGIYTSGNHEWYNPANISEFESTSGFKRLGKADNVTTNAYEVYCIGAYQWDPIGGFQQNDINALTTYLSGVSKSKPVFILSHYPLHYINSRTITNAKAVIDVLNKYPNAVFMWGHNHSQKGNETHYGEVKSFGDSIQYTNSASATINFTYACAGNMNNDQGVYDGCVAAVKGTNVTFYYYDADGTKETIKNRNAYSYTVDITKGNQNPIVDPTVPGNDVTFVKATTIENGKQYIFAGQSGSSDSGYLLSTTANNNKFTITPKPTGAVEETITLSAADAANVTWTATGSNGSFSFKNGSQYLKENSNSGVLFGTAADTFTVSGTQIKSGNTTLCYGSNSISQTYLFNFNTSTTGDSKPVFVYVKNDGGVIPTPGQTSVNVPAAVTGLVYNGNLQTGVSTADGYTLIGNTATSAGNYTATATLRSGYKWSDNTTAPKTISWSISKATPTVTAPSASAITSGQALSTSILSGGQALLNGRTVQGTFAWENSAVVPAVSDSNKTEYNVTFTPSDTTNYNNVTCKAKVTVNKSALTKIAITTVPSKVVYTEGDKFDAKDMVVTATYADGSTEAITDYTVDPSGELKLEDKTVTISYTENGVATTAVQNITVKEMETVATPVLIEESVFIDWKLISIKCDTEGAEIHYTVDGKVPTAESTKYEGSFLIYDTTTVKAIAVKEGMNESAVATTTYTRGLPFVDVNIWDWFFNDVYFVYVNDIMEGTATTIFNPDLFTTRGMIVTMLYRMENEPASGGINPFLDVASGKWYTDAIKWAYRNNIVEGYSDTEFRPEQTISREQMAAILYRYSKFKGYDLSAGEDTNILSYADAQSVSSYAVPAIQWAVGEGLIQGLSSTVLSPKTGATRAQVAAIIHRFYENVK